MSDTVKITALASCGWAFLITLVTGSRVTSFVGTSPEFTTAVGLGMLTTSLVCLGVGYASTNRVSRFRMPVFAAFALFGILGCGLLWLTPQVPTLAGCLLVGTSLGCGYLLWGEVLTHLDRKNIIAAALISMAIWGITGSLITLIDEYSYRMGLLIIVVIANALCYGFCWKVCRSTCTDNNPPRDNAPTRTIREVLSLIWQPMLLVSVLGFSSGLLRVLNASDGADPLTLSSLRCLCTIIIVGLFLALSNQSLGFEQGPISLCLLIAAASALLLLPIVELRFRVFIALIIDVAYLLSGLFLTVACALTGSNVRGTSMLSVGLGQGVSVFFITTGFALSSLVSASDLINDQGPWILALAAIYAIVIVLLLLNMPHFRRLGKKAAISSAREESQPTAATQSTAPQPKLDPTASDDTPLRHDDDMSFPLTPSHPTTNEVSTWENTSETSGHSRKNVVHLILSVPESALRTNKALTSTYRITNREMDVLILTLSGRNASAIAQMLFVSEGTVRTHLKHIYKKLNIHSKEELHRLVETVLEGNEL